MNKKRFVIIVAGGEGLRMGAPIPKQFLELLGKPILIHTIEKFLLIKPHQLILVIPFSHTTTVVALLKKFMLRDEVVLVNGGKTRFGSVKNGLMSISNQEGLVAIHDAVRPLITQSVIEESFVKAAKYDSGVVSVPLKDSIRKIDGDKNYAVDRGDFQSIQTPQTFNLKLLKEAFDVSYQSIFTDDASVFEKKGHQIHLVEGDYANIKITTPEDLIVAESFLSSQKETE